VKGQDTEVRPAAIVRVTATAALAGLTVLATLAGCAAAPGSAAKGPAAATTRPVSLRRQVSPSPSAHPTPTPKPKPEPTLAALPVASADAASEPQTGKLPDTSSTAFTNEVHDIWLAVITGNAAYAKPAFFPEKAYEQVKAISDPDYDWQDRLWYDFTLDLAAVHKLVPRNAKLETVLVPVHDAVWIPVGACYNNVGYWHVSNSRVVYRADGATDSFGIASFISWRGAWYLIHFGAVVRSGDYGIVDDPETGPGSAGPTANC
jgi:hypothetical protein